MKQLKCWQRICQKLPQKGDKSMFMFKKIIVSGLVVAVLSTFILGTSVWTYVKTCGNEIRATVKSQVPIEFEVKRAQQLVGDLVPEIREAMHVIAEQQVEVEALENAITKREAGLAKQKEAILSLREKLDEEDTQYVIAGRSYSEQQVEKDLSTRFNRYQLTEETLVSEQSILEARKSALAANEDHLATLISTKKDLEAQLAQLDARMRALHAAEAASDVKTLDHTALNRAKSLISELNTQLEIKERLVQVDGNKTGLIPVERELEPKEDVVETIDTYFEKELSDRPL